MSEKGGVRLGETATAVGAPLGATHGQDNSAPGNQRSPNPSLRTAFISKRTVCETGALGQNERFWSPETDRGASAQRHERILANPRNRVGEVSAERAG